MKDFESFDKIKKFIQDWKEESDSILEAIDPIDIADFDERNSYNQEVGINACLYTILKKMYQIENEPSVTLA